MNFPEIKGTNQYLAEILANLVLINQTLGNTTDATIEFVADATDYSTIITAGTTVVKIMFTSEEAAADTTTTIDFNGEDATEQNIIGNATTTEVQLDYTCGEQKTLNLTNILIGTQIKIYLK